jgi:hypothetical protein
MRNFVAAVAMNRLSPVAVDRERFDRFWFSKLSDTRGWLIGNGGGLVLSNGLARQIRTEQSFDLRPNFGVALDLNMPFGKQTRIPRKVPALWRLGSILAAEIPNNSGSLWIGGSDQRTAMNQTVSLVKIRSLGHIGRNRAVVAERFGHGIDFDRWALCASSNTQPWGSRQNSNADCRPA